MNSFLPNQGLVVTKRLTENGPTGKNGRKFKPSVGSINCGRNSNSLAKDKTNTSTSSCGSLTRSNKAIRKNKPKLKVKRTESTTSNATSESRQMLLKNSKTKLKAISSSKRNVSVKSIAGKRFLA